MVKNSEEEVILAARALKVLLVQVPFITLASSLIAPAGHTARAIIWGCIVPWSILGVVSKLNK